MTVPANRERSPSGSGSSTVGANSLVLPVPAVESVALAVIDTPIDGIPDGGMNNASTHSPASIAL